MTELGWPARVCIARRNYPSCQALESFKANVVRQALEQRSWRATWRQTMLAVGLRPEVSEEDRVLVAELGSIGAASDIAQRKRDDFEPAAAPTPPLITAAPTKDAQVSTAVATQAARNCLTSINCVAVSACGCEEGC